MGLLILVWLVPCVTLTLIAVTESTKIRGIMDVTGEKALMMGMKLRITMKRKYMLATRWNCSNRFFGRNVRIVYLVVRMLKKKKKKEPRKEREGTEIDEWRGSLGA